MAGVNHDEAIQQFLGFTSGTHQEAQEFLEANNFDVEAAVDSYFASTGEAEEDSDHEPAIARPSVPSSTVPLSGGRTLAGGSAPAQSAPSRSTQPSTSRRPPQRSGPVTIGDLSSGGGHGHAHDDDDDDDEEPGQDLFAGGEKSGLAVQNPGSAMDVMNRIFQRAQENAPRPGGEDEEQPGGHAFGGRGVTLGGDDAPSTVIEDPQATRPRPLPRVSRTLHVWRNGFSIDDGPLRDPQADPENARILQMILHGHAPMHILNVEPGQEVDMNLDNRKDEMFVQPKTQYKPFSGSGQRLGDEGASTTSATSATSSSAQAKAPSSTAATASSLASSSSPSVSVDSSQPTITLQIRLGDGTRLQSRFNTTHTVGDIYGFVNAASPASNQRSYVLSSTFPPKDFDDQSAVLGDLAEFKRGGVVVQKWK